MSQLFFTSDCHFGHTNIIKYESRPFHTTKEMNDEIIRRWNKRIGPDDKVIFLGDFCLHNVDYCKSILARLNYGSMLWIKGNHDKGLHTLNEFPRVFAVKEAVIKIDKIGYVYLTHRPINPSGINGIGTILHGHVHGREGKDVIHVQNGKTFFHVGVDTNRLRPWHVQEIVREYRKFHRSNS